MNSHLSLLAGTTQSAIHFFIRQHDDGKNDRKRENVEPFRRQKLLRTIKNGKQKMYIKELYG